MRALVTGNAIRLRRIGVLDRELNMIQSRLLQGFEPDSVEPDA